MMAISADNLVKSYRKQLVLDGVTLQVPPGRIMGLLGPNGAGKSTTLRILAGSLAPDRGEVTVFGTPLDPTNAQLRNRIGYLPEDNPLYPDMYIEEFLRFVGRLHNLPSPVQRVREVIELTGLGPEQHKQIGQLSKGYRQRVGLAQAIIHDPDILILDEPTSGLDPNQLLGIRQLIRRLGEKKAVLLSTHIMQEVEALCDQVAIIHQGRIVARGTPDELRSTHGTDSLETLFVGLTQT